MSGFVTINTEKLQAAADEIGLAASVVQRTAYRAINGVAAKTLTRARRAIVSQVNLSASYVRDRMSLSKANSTRLRAVIAGRQRPTRLATYRARQLTKNAKRAKGDPLRGIGSGRKQAGVAVSVTRGGSSKAMRGAFMIPLRRGETGGGNGMGVFIRTGGARNNRSLVEVGATFKKRASSPGKVESGDLRHLYGPSVDDVLSGVIRDIEDDVQGELEAALIRQARYEFGKALKTT